MAEKHSGKSPDGLIVPSASLPLQIELFYLVPERVSRNLEQLSRAALIPVCLSESVNQPGLLGFAERYALMNRLGLDGLFRYETGGASIGMKA